MSKISHLFLAAEAADHPSCKFHLMIIFFAFLMAHVARINLPTAWKPGKYSFIHHSGLIFNSLLQIAAVTWSFFVRFRIRTRLSERGPSSMVYWHVILYLHHIQNSLNKVKHLKFILPEPAVTFPVMFASTFLWKWVSFFYTGMFDWFLRRYLCHLHHLVA